MYALHQRSYSISETREAQAPVDCTSTLDHLKEAWQKDLGVEITENQRKKAKKHENFSSICVKHRL